MEGRAVALKFACSLCGCNEPRAGCPRCEERQPTLFSLPPPFPDDADTTTLEEIVLEARERERRHAARIAKLTRLGRAVKVGLVGCAKTKRDREAPARDLYRSPLFTMALAHAERVCDETHIVSAAHGLLPLDEIVQPYDRALSELPKKERLAWGARLVGALAARFASLPLHLVILAGLEYARPIQAAAHGRAWEIETPLAKKTIGARLAWLRSAAPLAAKRKRRGAA